MWPTFLIMVINKDESLRFAVVTLTETGCDVPSLPVRKFDCIESPSDMRLMVRGHSISDTDISGTQTEHQSSVRECIQWVMI